MKIEDRLVEEAHVLLHPVRFRIVELLAEKPMHINAISNALGEEKIGDSFLTIYRLWRNTDSWTASTKYLKSRSQRGKRSRYTW
ncbi:MAG: hypothetical protein QMD80_05205 [archaeon]|nr:hypothetical protein [archaeon]